MKVVITSNFALETYAEKLHASGLTREEAERAAERWNEEYGGPFASGYAQVKSDNYVLWRGMADLAGDPELEEGED